jgi:hypothetical protein
LARCGHSEATMSPETRDVLEQSRRLLEKRESGQSELEASIQDSKRALARSERMLTKLRDTLAQALRARKAS